VLGGSWKRLQPVRRGQGASVRRDMKDTKRDERMDLIFGWQVVRIENSEFKNMF
jgi:very-short-patch-repair endonuclease